MTKDEWIQQAKALLFDCCFDLESKGLARECNELIIKGGGYNYKVESCETELRWRKDD